MSSGLRPSPYFIVFGTIALIAFTVSLSGKANSTDFENKSISGQTPPRPPTTLKINNPGFLCEDGDPIQLQLTIIGLTGNLNISWSGQAITDPDGWFAPKLGMPGGNKVYVHFIQGNCIYIDSLEVAIFMKPIASFKLEIPPCKDSLLQIISTGYAFASWNWHWNFGGADTEIINWPSKFSALWNKPGN